MKILNKKYCISIIMVSTKLISYYKIFLILYEMDVVTGVDIAQLTPIKVPLAT